MVISYLPSHIRIFTHLTLLPEGSFSRERLTLNASLRYHGYLFETKMAWVIDTRQIKHAYPILPTWLAQDLDCSLLK